MKKCPQCGCENADELKFCGQCGKSFTDETVICKHCGAECGAELNFCGQCGKPLSADNETVRLSTTGFRPKPKKNLQKKKTDRKTKILLVVILAIGVIGILTPYLLGKKNLSDPIDFTSRVEITTNINA